MTKCTTTPEIFTSDEVRDLLGLTMKPEEARAQLNKRLFNRVLLIDICTVAILVFLFGFVFTPRGEWAAVCLVGGVCIAVVVSIVMYNLLERHYTSPIKTEKVVVWQRELVAMRGRSRSVGLINDIYIKGFDKGYRYLYDNGGCFELAEIPGEKTKVYLELEAGISPYIVCWQERCYRESLLTDPPTRLPYESDDEYNDYLELEDPFFYDVYLPKESYTDVFELF